MRVLLQYTYALGGRSALLGHEAEAALNHKRRALHTYLFAYVSPIFGILLCLTMPDNKRPPGEKIERLLLPLASANFHLFGFAVGMRIDS